MGHDHELNRLPLHNVGYKSEEHRPAECQGRTPRLLAGLRLEIWGLAKGSLFGCWFRRLPVITKTCTTCKTAIALIGLGSAACP